MSTTVGGRYQIVRELGAGGMGRVCQAVDKTTGRAVAVKIMTGSDEDMLDSVLRFHQEGAILASLKHPNIVEVYSVLLEDGSSYIIMELLEGQSLAEILRNGRLPLSRLQGLMVQAATSLAYAHEHGIIHRDVKPANIMVIGDDHVKLTDFGIARIQGPGTVLATRTGMAIGTPLYMSPEQIEARKVDGRADIYSLGAVMYHAVADRPPFEGGEPLSIAFAHVHKVPESPRSFNTDLPPDWEALILKTLEKDPARRFQSAADLLTALSQLGDQAASPQPSGIQPPTLPPPSPRVDPTPSPATPSPATPVTISPVPSPEPTAAAPTTPPPAGPPAGPPPRPTPRALPSRSLLLAGIGGAIVLLGLLLFALFHGLPGRTTASGPAIANRFVAQWGSAGSGPGEFHDPEGVATDAKGNVYVADFANNRIQEFSSSGTFRHAWGSFGPGRGQFSGPSGVAVDVQGDIYVADSLNSRVEELAPDGTMIRSWGSLGTKHGQFNGDLALAVDRAGNVDVADTNNNRVQKFTSNGTFVGSVGTPAGGRAHGRFRMPVGVAVDTTDNVYIADFSNDRVQKLAPDGGVMEVFKEWATAGVHPHGVAVDGRGIIYVANYAGDDIQALSSTGKPLGKIGGPGTEPGQFHHPNAIAVDAKGDLYVADSDNERIQELAPAH